MELQPKRQPGRADRKAAAYTLEIVRLRGAGYTYEAIREAMAEVGIALSTSALRREVRRLRAWPSSTLCDSQSRSRSTAAQPVDTVPPDSSAPPPCSATRPDSGCRETAEAFFNAHPSNPLMRTKGPP